MSCRILLVSNFFPPHTVGGAEIVAFRQMRALAARGHHVVVLGGAEPTPAAPPGSLIFDVYDGIPVYRLSLQSLSPDSNFYWPAAARRLKAIIASHEIDVVHFHNIMGVGANLIPTAKAFGIRCLMTVHDHWGFCFRNTLLRDDGAICANHEECSACLSTIQAAPQLNLPIRLRRDYVAWCVRQVDQLIFPSAYLASAYRHAGFPDDRILVLSNGIDLQSVPGDQKQASAHGAVRFLWSGYLGEHKGVFVLLDALSQLAQDPEAFRRCFVTIAGDGHLRPKLEAALKSRNLTQQVRFLGRVPRSAVLDLLPATDVCVLTSVWPENEPVTLLEAIASGTAQIASRIGGNPELVEEGHSGLLFNPGDATDLARAMRAYIAEPSLAVAHGKRNLERRTAFDETRTIDKLEAILTRDKTVSAVPSSEPVVICGSGPPPPQAGILLQHVHDYLLPGMTPRFIWHEWLSEGELWKTASLLWLWDRNGAEALINHALRRGIPILAPLTEWTEGLTRHYGSVVLYQTYLEALAALRVLLTAPPLLDQLSQRARAASQAATALSSSVAFFLPSEVAF